MNAPWMTPVICLTMAIGLCFVSGRITFEHRQDVVHQQAALLEGKAWTYDGKTEYLPMFQNRLLFPAAMMGLERVTPLDLGESYQVARLLTVFVSLWGIVWVAQRIARTLAARDLLLVMMMLFYTFIFTFNFPPGEVPSDLPDALFTALFAWAAHTRRYAWLAVFSLTAALNRESAAFAGIVWIALTFDFDHARRRQLRTLMEGGLLSVGSYAFVLVIRHLMTDYSIALEHQQFVLGGAGFWAQLLTFLHAPHPGGWPVLLLAAMIPFALLLGRISQWHSTERRLLVAAAALALISLIFGYVNELRVFIPSLVLLNLACAHRLGRTST